jgi:hypothetical protein
LQIFCLNSAAVVSNVMITQSWNSLASAPQSIDLTVLLAPSTSIRGR